MLRENHSGGWSISRGCFVPRAPAPLCGALQSRFRSSSSLRCCWPARIPSSRHGAIKSPESSPPGRSFPASSFSVRCWWSSSALTASLCVSPRPCRVCYRSRASPRMTVIVGWERLRAKFSSPPSPRFSGCSSRYSSVTSSATCRACPAPASRSPSTRIGGLASSPSS